MSLNELPDYLSNRHYHPLSLRGCRYCACGSMWHSIGQL